MISKSTVDTILETARIEEVVSDFVSLKKRGSNLIGLCPFHNERTPSFSVSPTKGIYKCFGCGKAGNAVGFVMEHEHYSFPEALRFLAARYNIPVEEEFSKDDHNEAAALEKESLFIVSAYAQEFYSAYLFSSEEGKSTGLTYFEERGFSEKTIRKFQLGFAPASGNAFTELALKNGYLPEYLVKSGLSIGRDEKTGTDAASLYDRFRGRVIFPIHNLTGRVIAFGARILRKDPKAPKYINSPETEIYHKSNILYGIHFAKKAIIEKDNCLLVEGYTDVISLHQAGVENAVASSGTSLTVEQIRLISRYTKNITVLFDGDAAGIKASLRGIDLILEQGLNVKVLLFPDGADPDSFAQSHSASETVAFIRENAQDFIRFKTSLLLSEVSNDPVARAGLIREIVESIARIPDAIIREMYVQQCSELLQVSEQTLISELNKIRRKMFLQPGASHEDSIPDEMLIENAAPQQVEADELNSDFQEAEIIRILLNYGNRDVEFLDTDERGHSLMQKMKTRDVLVNEIMTDGIGFSNPLLAGIFSYFSNAENTEFERVLDDLKNHNEQELRNRAIDFLTSRHQLSDWEKHGIHVKTEEHNFLQAVLNPLYHLKLKRVLKMKKENQEQIRRLQDQGESISLSELEQLYAMEHKFNALIRNISQHLGIVTLK